MIPGLANHLWQSTVFAVATGLLMLVVRGNRARVRYWLWLAASVKFLVPFALLIGIGAQLHWRAPGPPLVRAWPAQVWMVKQPFGAVAGHFGVGTRRAPERSVPVDQWLLALWACGSAMVAVRWWVRWRRIHNAWRAASPVDIEAPIPVLASHTLLEPGVFGIFRPVLLLPEGIAERLGPEQFQAILAHELNHVRARDNLTAAMHMVVEAVFWFHPLVWWIGARLVEERERACEEAVCAQGCEAGVYAQAILDVCKWYCELPLECAAGVTGADLKRRIERVMAHRIAPALDFGKKLLLTAASMMAVALPLAIGMLNAPASRAQETDSPPKLAVASVKLSQDVPMGITTYPGGRLTADGPLSLLIMDAYKVPPYRISGGPAWIDADRYAIEATPEADPGPSRRVLLLQPVLEDRFNLKFHRETRELPIYVLGPAMSGLKLTASEPGCIPLHTEGLLPPLPSPPEPGKPFHGPCGYVTVSARSGMLMFGSSVPMSEFTRVLSVLMRRTIIDKTGVTGAFDVRLQFIPDQATAGLPLGPPPPVGPGLPPPPADAASVSVFEALQEQLGLKLESGKGPVEVMVIDHVERPSEN
jgi:bla regulator protein blaR1